MSKEDLIPINKRTKDEQKEITTKGGLASGAARRKKRDLKQKIKWLYDLAPTNDQIKQIVDNLPIELDDVDNELVEIIGLHNSASRGNHKAFITLQEYAGNIIPRNIKLTGDMNNYNFDMTEKLQKLSVDELRALANGKPKTKRRGA